MFGSPNPSLYSNKIIGLPQSLVFLTTIIKLDERRRPPSSIPPVVAQIMMMIIKLVMKKCKTHQRIKSHNLREVTTVVTITQAHPSGPEHPGP